MEAQAERIVAACRECGRARGPHGARRGRAPAPLEGTQVRVRRLRPRVARLHGDGRRHPAHEAAVRAPPRERDRRRHGPARRQRVPRRRRQPPPEHPLRSAQAGRGGAGGGGGRRDHEGLRRGRRLDLRRARHRPREGRLHAVHLLGGRSRADAAAQERVQSRRALQPRQDLPDARSPASRSGPSPTGRTRSKKRASPSASSAGDVAAACRTRCSTSSAPSSVPRTSSPASSSRPTSSTGARPTPRSSPAPSRRSRAVMALAAEAGLPGRRPGAAAPPRASARRRPRPGSCWGCAGWTGSSSTSPAT